MATPAKQNVEPMVIVPCGYNDGVMFPASIASLILPVMRRVTLEYGKLPEFKAGDSQLGGVPNLECKVITAETVTAMYVAERISKESAA